MGGHEWRLLDLEIDGFPSSSQTMKWLRRNLFLLWGLAILSSVTVTLSQLQLQGIIFFFFGACCNYVLTSMVGRWISDLEPALLGGFKVNLFRNSAPELESAWKMEGLEDIRRNSFWVVKRPIFSSKSVSFLGTPKTNGELDTQPPMNLARRRWDETPQGRFWP